MGRVFKTRWMRKTAHSEDALCTADVKMAQSLVDADLDGAIVKKRVGLAVRGKRAGAKTLVASNKDKWWFFVYGFEKNDCADISQDALEALKDIAEQLLARTSKQLDVATKDGSLTEKCHDPKISGQEPHF
jgi:hypothetical protein